MPRLYCLVSRRCREWRGYGIRLDRTPAIPCRITLLRLRVWREIANELAHHRTRGKPFFYEKEVLSRRIRAEIGTTIPGGIPRPKRK
jgi:hypothetical protein